MTVGGGANSRSEQAHAVENGGEITIESRLRSKPDQPALEKIIRNTKRSRPKAATVVVTVHESRQEDQLGATNLDCPRVARAKLVERPEIGDPLALHDDTV